jgi:uncharacterized protein (DUF1330 family)
MKKGYWIVRVDITDQDKFVQYVNANPKALTKYEAKYLARAGKFEVPEGSTRTRNTIVEFPSYQAALDCWNSAEYQEAKTYRDGAAEIDIVIVEGYEEDPQS